MQMRIVWHLPPIPQTRPTHWWSTTKLFCHTDIAPHPYNPQPHCSYNRNSERSERSSGICSQHGPILPTSPPHGVGISAKSWICRWWALNRTSTLKSQIIYRTQILKAACRRRGKKNREEVQLPCKSGNVAVPYCPIRPPSNAARTKWSALGRAKATSEWSWCRVWLRPRIQKAAPGLRSKESSKHQQTWSQLAVLQVKILDSGPTLASLDLAKVASWKKRAMEATWKLGPL